MNWPLQLSLVTALALAGGACGEPASGGGGTDVLYLRSAGSVVVVAPGAAAPAYRQRAALPSGDWSTMVHTERSGRTTEVVATDPETGEVRWRDVVPGNLVANAVSYDGNLVAMSPARERYYRFGRTETTFVVAGRWTGTGRRITVAGNYEPEAFSSDGTSLFVISYLPARAPAQYQVRRVDLTAGTVEGVFTPDAKLQERMGGTARVQTASTDGTRLYTLYTIKNGDGSRQAFVHVLNLADEWAHCIDLPAGFADDPGSSTALAVSPDGARLYVASTSSDVVAEVDTDTMKVIRTATFDLDPRGRSHAAVDGGGTLFVTGGPWVVAVDTGSLTEADRWSMDDWITGVQASEEGTSVYLGLEDRIATVDLETGTTRMTDPRGIGRIRELGPVLQPVDEEPYLKCAC